MQIKNIFVLALASFAVADIFDKIADGFDDIGDDIESVFNDITSDGSDFWSSIRSEASSIGSSYSSGKTTCLRHTHIIFFRSNLNICLTKILPLIQQPRIQPIHSNCQCWRRRNILYPIPRIRCLLTLRQHKQCSTHAHSDQHRSGSRSCYNYHNHECCWSNYHEY